MGSNNNEQHSNNGGNNNITGGDNSRDSQSCICSKRFILISSVAVVILVAAITLGLFFGLRDNSVPAENDDDGENMNPCFNRNCPVDLCFCNTVRCIHFFM